MVLNSYIFVRNCYFNYTVFVRSALTWYNLGVFDLKIYVLSVNIAKLG